jgi:hypothetical protein
MDQTDHVNVGASATTRFEDAFRTYEATLQQLGTSSQLERRAADAYAAYVSAVQRAAPSSEAQREIEEAHRRYADVVAEALAENGTRERFDAAFRDYLVNLQRSWAEVDVAHLDASAIAEVGQHMAAIAWMAMTGEANGDQPEDG